MQTTLYSTPLWKTMFDKKKIRYGWAKLGDRYLLLLAISFIPFGAFSGPCNFNRYLPPGQGPGFHVISILADTSVTPQKDTLANERTPIMIWADHMPRFRGAATDRESKEYILYYLQPRVKYPPAAQVDHLEGTVYVTFVIEQDGSVSHVRAMNFLGDGLMEEAVDVIKHMPRWTPGRLNDKPVRVQFTIPISFVIPKSGIR